MRRCVTRAFGCNLEAVVGGIHRRLKLSDFGIESFSGALSFR